MSDGLIGGDTHEQRVVVH